MIRSNEKNASACQKKRVSVQRGNFFVGRSQILGPPFARRRIISSPPMSFEARVLLGGLRIRSEPHVEGFECIIKCFKPFQNNLAENLAS